MPPSHVLFNVAMPDATSSSIEETVCVKTSWFTISWCISSSSSSISRTRDEFLPPRRFSRHYFDRSLNITRFRSTFSQSRWYCVHRRGWMDTLAPYHNRSIVTSSSLATENIIIITNNNKNSLL